MIKYLALIGALFATGAGLAWFPSASNKMEREPVLDVNVTPLPGANVASKLSYCDTDFDALTLSVSGPNNVPGITLPICSAYGKASARSFQDGRGRNYVLLEHGEGRGTNATTDYLSVFRVGEDSLTLVMKTELEWGTGAVTRFGYSYWAHPTRTGMEITFAGHHDGNNNYEWCCTPPDMMRVVRIDAKYRAIPSPTSQERTR